MADVLAVVIHLLQLLKFPLPIPQHAGNLVSLIATLTAMLSNQNYVNDMKINPNPALTAPPQVYDFIIVGAGTAGAVVANRLSANPKFNVLLLEAGGDPSFLNTIPALAALNMHQQDTDWHYKATPGTNYGFGMTNNTIRLSRFKGLGGCSSHNWLVYNRGHPKDFDNWAKLTGDESWNYEHALKYFKKFENYRGKYPDAHYHGKDGPFSVGDNNDWSVPSVEAWIDAGAELGYEVGRDFNSRQRQSFGKTDLKRTVDGRRSDTYTTYIKPILSRPNFKVIRFAHVEKVILDESKRAVGVIYKRHDEKFEVRATREVILSAGTIGTTQLMLLSGIGPKEHLKSVNVESLVDLPGVGEKLEDHAVTILGPILFDKPVSFMPSRDINMKDAEEYAQKGTGYFAANSLGGFTHIASSVSDDPNWGDVQVFQFPFGNDPLTPYLLNTVFGLKDGLLEEYLKPYMGMDGNFPALNVGRPKSTGTIRLASNNPEDHPLIDPNYYDHPDDMKAQVDGFKLIEKMYEHTKAFGKYGSRLPPTKFPGCEHFELRTDAYYECFARHTTTSLFHLSGTCKMGRANDPKAVVDSRLRVFKVKGLRIADASIMPKITNANINTPTLMIGEKAADMILSDYADASHRAEL